ncbi:nucleoside recognition protein [bacterium]|nr:nucleoside recognition protein [bacterium]
MNYIFFILITVSIIAGMLNGKLEEVISAMFDGCNLAIKIAFSLIGIMAFWLGIMKIAEKAGLINLISKIIFPILKPLFKDLDKNSPTLGNICMSISANALGLTNAATPIGLKVMKELQEENKNKNIASDSMCMFLGMNTAGFQIIPATVIAILVGVGAKNPSEIILPTLIVTTLAFIIAIFTALILRRIWNKEEEI